jgi:hypothetical protein
MADKRTPKSSQADAVAPAAPELNNPDFQLVLKALLAAYQPVLEQQLALVKNPQELQKQEQAAQPRCADEFAEAYALFRKFLTEDVAQRLLPAQARELLGPIDQWRWCYEHILCCLVFGWLVCRWPRTFRGYAYYLYEYWKCVRQVVGTPVNDPPTEEQRGDFETLVNILAGAFKPYLTDQLASVEYPAAVPEEVIAGTIDCSTDDQEACAIFERLLTVDAARALLGSAAFEKESQESYFWFCRCWCLCSMCFGCCLARARTVKQVVSCLERYSLCLRDCFRPLTCAITSPAPDACAVEQYYAGLGVWGVEIVGTAAGVSCGHYILEWKNPLAPPSAYTQAFIAYPPPAPPTGPGACGVVSGPLGYLQTFGTPVPTDVEIRLTVFSSQAGQAPCVTEVSFQIFEQRVSIENVGGINVPDWFDPNSQLIGVPSGPTPPGTTRVLSFGDAMEIAGHAWVGGCSNAQVKRYTLSYQAGFVTNPKAGSWTQFWEVDYNSPLEQAQISNTYMDLTGVWQFEQICFPPIPPCPRPVPPFAQPYPIQFDQLSPGSWYSGVESPCSAGPAAPPGQGPYPIDPQLPLAPGNIWASQTLPTSNCYSGQYTLLLTVEDTSGNFYYDTQEVWFDNKAVYGEITGILGVAPCAVINLSQIPNAGNCSVVWPLAIEGIAYDEYIIEGNTTSPSDNFGGYCLTLTRQGGSESGCTPFSLSVALPVPNSTSPATVGTNRVGDPGVRCATASPPPIGPVTKSPNVLTTMDARIFDATCGCHGSPAAPSGFALNRADPTTGQPGECCAFFFTLNVWDNTVCEFLSGGRHYASAPCVLVWPVYICNDLPPLPPGTPPPCP